MKLIRRYWAVGLIVGMIATHAVVISYLRTRVASLSSSESPAFELGSFRVQSSSNLETIYHFRLHAVIDPAKLHRGRDKLSQMRMEICESTEQLLRQSDPKWFKDPSQLEIREQIMEIVRSNLDEALVQRVMITDWLELPVEALDISLAPTAT